MKNNNVTIEFQNPNPPKAGQEMKTVAVENNDLQNRSARIRRMMDVVIGDHYNAQTEVTEPVQQGHSLSKLAFRDESRARNESTRELGKARMALIWQSSNRARYMKLYTLLESSRKSKHKHITERRDFEQAVRGSKQWINKQYLVATAHW
ncbi:hypothetical protein FISHEDRAFT_62947 [Fistulina hepatica ATCC 64428]|uniref:Uncharacterized protein n=1 Tax=Fistulina hepatica ATCC 64428 TaxID=1128425 RepID=A0A0D6ZZV2_9AGAR|nr:hypothetical protein FISHEDRAFT_62947 [Fistulina hepatica ATCC 64428]